MADSGNVIGQFRDEIEQAAGDVASEVKDQAEQAAEGGMQSIFGTKPPQATPQQAQSFDSAQDRQKEEERQKKLYETRRILKWHNDIAEAQKKVREEQKQKERQRLQGGQPQKQEAQVKLVEQKQQKQKILAPTPVSNIENKNKMAA